MNCISIFVSVARSRDCKRTERFTSRICQQRVQPEGRLGLPRRTVRWLSEKRGKLSHPPLGE